MRRLRIKASLGKWLVCLWLDCLCSFHTDEATAHQGDTCFDVQYPYPYSHHPRFPWNSTIIISKKSRKHYSGKSPDHSFCILVVKNKFTHLDQDEFFRWTCLGKNYISLVKSVCLVYYTSVDLTPWRLLKTFCCRQKYHGNHSESEWFPWNFVFTKIQSSLCLVLAT